jgi:hypothetical protein
MTERALAAGSSIRRGSLFGSPPYALAAFAWLAVAGGLVASCGPALRPAVSLRLAVDPATPADASVSIDEQFIGVLGYVAARGVRLPEGEHRISVEREGYFPWDALVVSDRKPIYLRVKLERLPD